MITRMQTKTILFFLAFVLGAGSGRAAEIQFHQRTQIQGAIIRLGDIATIRGEPAEVAKLKELELAVAPSNGTARQFGWQQIRELLILRGVSPVKHRMSGSATVLVRSMRAGAATAPNQNQGHGAGVGQPNRSDNLVVVSTKPLRRGQLIGRNDVRLEAHKARLNPQMVQDLEGVIGMQVSRSVATGRILQSRDIQAPILVRRSELATLYVRVGQVRIRMNVKALSDAALHDTVSVESLETKQRYSARVIGYQEVEVLAEGVSQPSFRQPEPDRRARYTPNHGRDAKTVQRQSPFRTASYPRGNR